MRNRLWLSISMMIIATLILAACGSGRGPGRTGRRGSTN